MLFEDIHNQVFALVLVSYIALCSKVHNLFTLMFIRMLGVSHLMQHMWQSLEQRNSVSNKDTDYYNENE